MGSIIFVPPPHMFDITEPSTQNMPVSFVAGYGNMQASVTPLLGTVRKIHYDPLMSYHQFHSFNRMTSATVQRKQLTTAYPMVHSLTLDEVNAKFWDTQEVVDIVKGFAGDLFLQIITDQSRWNLSTVNPDDGPALSQLMQHRKNHRFEVDQGLRDLVLEWLTENATEWDHSKGGSWSNGITKDTVFVRDNVEAIHFKMRWFGSTPEDEGIEPVEDDVPF